MANQYDSLSEKAKMIDISLRYTAGDMNKAKAMASGQYSDIAVLKGKYMIPGAGQSGMFLAFFNIAEEYIADLSSIVSLDSSLYEKVRIFDDWKALYGDMIAYRQGEDSVDSQPLSDFLLDSFIEFDLFPDVQENKIDNLSRSVTDILAKSFNSVVQTQIECERTSSLNMELAGISIGQPSSSEGDDNLSQQSVLKPVQLTPEEQRMNKIENEAKYVIEGRAIVSPVKGKYINDIAVGEKIKVLLNASDPVSEKILRVLNAIDEDRNISAIKGRIKEKIPIETGGYVLYTLVAKDVLAKIVEEENVKIQIDKPLDEEAVKQKGESKIVLSMAILVSIIIILGIILFKLM